nr:SDR family oxidoreductase [Kineosporia babensis]
MFSSIAAHRGSGQVNVVAPGYIAETEIFQGSMSSARHDTLVGQTLTGRAGLPRDVSQTVRWLASPTTRHVSEQIIQVNGGASLGH